MSVFRQLPLAFLLALAAGCNAPDQAKPAVLAPAASATSGLSAAARGRAFHYELVLSITDGANTTRSTCSLDIAEPSAALVSLTKNVVTVKTARADVGTQLKARLTMQGDVPHLELGAEISGVDATGTLYKAAPNGSAATPLGIATTVIDATEAGRHIVVSATPTPSADIGAESMAKGEAVLDLVATHSADPKSTALSLTISGAAPAMANSMESKPLQETDAGTSQRYQTGTRVRVTGKPRSGGMQLDFDLELSAIEPATPEPRIRKIRAAGQLFAAYDKPISLFAAEEEARRYGVSVTLRRAK